MLSHTTCPVRPKTISLCISCLGTNWTCLTSQTDYKKIEGKKYWSFGQTSKSKNKTFFHTHYISSIQPSLTTHLPISTGSEKEAKSVWWEWIGRTVGGQDPVCVHPPLMFTEFCGVSLKTLIHLGSTMKIFFLRKGSMKKFLVTSISIFNTNTWGAGGEWYFKILQGEECISLIQSDFLYQKHHKSCSHSSSANHTGGGKERKRSHKTFNYRKYWAT